MKLLAGLGNPGPEYDATRHNAGWWVIDRVAYEWDFGAFEREGPVWVSRGVLGETGVILTKPATYMNRSGAALRSMWKQEEFDVSEDLLVIVDDAALDLGRVRFRPRGSAGGHNGLRSVESALGTSEYARLRVGVGQPPPGLGMKEWVLSEMGEEDEDVMVALLPELVRGVRVWVEEGIEPAMNQFNR